MTRLGVLGWPVAHSRSPALQNAALQAVGLCDWRYQLLPVAPALFAETVTALGAAGFRGANVTIPHKRVALALADRPTPRARSIGAVNTLLFEPDGLIAADNTDAPALIESLPFPVRGASALVLGAGGSARGAVWALLDAGAGQVRVWNRTPQRAGELCTELGATATDAIAGADLLVNCTSVGLEVAGDADQAMPIAREALDGFGFIADFVYRPGGTALINEARARGIGCVDGLELLVAQGALAFEQFTGIQAPVAAMLAAVGL